MGNRELTSELEAIINDFKKSGTDPDMQSLLEKMTSRPPTDEEIAYLAQCCARSGETLRLPQSPPTADIASTGGPTSLSTLLCPLYLRSLDYWVPKLGVPGRPAGGIDVLSQIPGYKILFDQEQATECLGANGYVHFLAGERFAPLDSRLFSYRQKTNMQAYAPLVTSSLLSKKIAAGVSLVGLDIRIASHGNFGDSIELARENAKQFCRVAKLLGLEAVCFLTQTNGVYQPFVGRGESLLALRELFDGKGHQQLQAHSADCFKMVRSLSGKTNLNLPTTARMRTDFEENVVAQNGSVEGFYEKAEQIERGHKIEIVAEDEGILHLDLATLRSILVEAQLTIKTNEFDFPDPCGVILSRMPGEYVRKGDLLCTLRTDDNTGRMKERIGRTLFITDHNQSGSAFEEVRYA